MKDHCFDYIKQLLPDLANNAEKIEKIKADIAKLENNTDAIKAYTDSIYKEEMENASKKIEDRVYNFQKIQDLNTKVRKLMTGTYQKSLLGKDKKRDFETALKHLVYQEGSYDLITSKIATKNRSLVDLYNSLSSVDKDLTSMMFGQNTRQMWEAVNILPIEKRNKVAVLKVSDDLQKILNVLNSKDTSKLKYKLADFDPKLVEYAKTLDAKITPLMEHLGVKKLDGFAGTQKYDKELVRKMSETEFSNKIIDEYGVDYGKMFDGTVKDGSLKLDKNGRFQSVVIIDRTLNFEKKKALNEIEKDILLRNKNSGVKLTDEQLKNEALRAYDTQRSFNSLVGLEKVITRKRLEKELWFIKEEITGGNISDNIFFKGENLQKRRTIHYKDVDTQIRVNKDLNYGENIVLQYRDAIANLSEKKFIYDKLGTQPLDTFNTIIQEYRRSRIGEGGTDKQLPFTIKNNRIENNTKAVEHVGHYIEELLRSSSYSFESNNALATTMKLLRAKATLKYLPKIAASYTADIHNVLYSQALQGKKIFSKDTVAALGQRYIDNIIGVLHSPFATTSIGKKGRDIALDKLEGRVVKDMKSIAIASHNLTGNINRYLSDNLTGVNTVDALQNLMMSSTHMIDTLQKNSARDMVSTNLISDIGSKMSELPKARQFYYEKYGIGEKEWEIARQHMVFEKGTLEGSNIKDSAIIPELAMNLEDNIIKDLAKGDILANGLISEKSLNKAREELRDKFDVLYNRTISQMMGEDRTGARLFFQRGSKAGTVNGELARGFSQLQTYSLGFYRNMFLGVLNHPVYSAAEKVGMLAGFSTIGALGGALPYKIISGVLAGREPESLMTKDGGLNWGMVSGLYEYSGAYTTYGEYFLRFAGKSKRSSSIYSRGDRLEKVIKTALGVAVGDALIGGADIYEAVKDGKVNMDYVANLVTSNTPNINPLQPLAMAYLNLNFFLSDEKVDKLKNNAEANDRPYFIPTK